MDSHKKDILAKVYKLGYEYEQTKGGCSQSVLAAIQDTIGLVDNSVFKSGQCLAAGGALTGQGTCGALSGGFMAISIWIGRDRNMFDNDQTAIKAQKISKKLYDRFLQEYGTCICCGVQKKIFKRSYNLWTELDKFLEAGGHIDKCPEVVAKTAQWTAELMLSN